MKESKGPASSAWDALTAGAVEIVDRQHLKARIERGDRLRVKLGLDPTRPDLHLGHTIALRAMRRFEDQGHTGVLIVGDWTARIGDPSGQNVTRPQLTREEVSAAADTYLNQLWKILDESRTEVRFQSEWFDRMRLDEVVRLMSQTTVARMLARDDFARRQEQRRPIGLHEFLYPLLQGYDSVAVKADLELGGTDQTFNLLVGRDLQQAAGQPAQDVMTLPLLEGLDGVQKMSKSLDNYIGIDEDPKDMFWKAMAVPDSLIVRYLELATDAGPAEVRAAREALAAGTNPRDVKKDLARRLVRLYHGAPAADAAEAAFLQSADLPERVLGASVRTMAELFLELGLVSSKSEMRRLVEQKGLFVDDRPVASADESIEPRTGMVARRGKRQAVTLRVQ
ncbi:MAG TPA: tyrosine--tRNA ligase [Candidatus Limnocylindrales bacterium]|nr:tyrosine--tRNA ligase [Candidatus Limnocylindrales bacterium]